MLIFDIGANTGNYIDYCLSRYPRSIIIGVEANDNLAKYLEQKFYNNKNIIIINHVVSSINNIDINFYISNINTISTASKEWIEKSRFSMQHKWDSIVQKKTITLDKMIDSYGKPDLIKIDVEGHELEVIKGLSSKQSEICFEWTEEGYANLHPIAEHLQNLGYHDFGFIYEDNYNIKPYVYCPWEELDLHKDINIERKEKWGMIWVR